MEALKNWMIDAAIFYLMTVKRPEIFAKICEITNLLV